MSAVSKGQYELQGTIKIFHISRNFTLSVASCISVYNVPRDYKVVCIEQVFCVHINEVPLAVGRGGEGGRLVISDSAK